MMEHKKCSKQTTSMRICMDKKTYVDDEQFWPFILHNWVFQWGER